MHPLRLVMIVLVCSLSLVGRSTSSPGTRTAYLGPVGGQSQAAPAPTPSWQSRLASIEMTSRSEARFVGASRRELWVPAPADVPPFEPAPAGEEPPPAPL